MDKQELLEYWASELIAVKMELEKISFLLREGVKPTRDIQRHLDNVLDRKRQLEALIEAVRGKK